MLCFPRREVRAAGPGVEHVQSLGFLRVIGATAFRLRGGRDARRGRRKRGAVGGRNVMGGVAWAATEARHAAHWAAVAASLRIYLRDALR